MSNSLKIVFLGTPEFAVESLKAIHHSNHEVVGVVTMPDKKKGRGRQLQGSAVKNYAVENNLLCLQPEKLKNEEFLSQLKSLNADLFVVVAFRMLPEAVWNMPKHGTVNVHGSLLPQYRGAAPINWAIINGEKETGVTVFKLKHKIDTGDILLRKSIPILEDDNAESVHDKLMVLGAESLIEAIDKIASGNPEYIPQISFDDLKTAPKIFKDTCLINWNQDVQTIHNFIRGLSPYPAAWSSFFTGGKEFVIKFYNSSIEIADVESMKNLHHGRIDTDGKNYVKIAGNNGWVVIHELQLSGKKRMATQDLLRGFKMETVTVK